jgi:hypothetical protein
MLAPDIKRSILPARTRRQQARDLKGREMHRNLDEHEYLNLSHLNGPAYLIWLCRGHGTRNPAGATL